MTSIDPKALLCESCGYPLVGLEPDGACPECGTDVEASLPQRRPGSAWQRREFGGWLTTIADFAGHPREGFRRMVIESERSLSLIYASTGVAALLASTPVIAIQSLAWFFGGRGAGLGLTAATIGGLWLLMLAAVGIEALGIRAFARRHGWRVTRVVATAVVAHACVGWVAGGVVVGGGVFVALLTGFISQSSIAGAIGLAGLGAGALIGLLWFEILVYVGVRQCRFANPPGAGERDDRGLAGRAGADDVGV